MRYKVKSIDTGWEGYREGSFQIRPHFKMYEFACHDESEFVKVSSEMLDKLQLLREILGIPLTINSAYRSLTFNRKIGSKDTSQHREGTAIDIRKSAKLKRKYSDEDIIRIATAIGFRGIGVYNTFIHLDTRKDPAFWDNRK